MECGLTFRPFSHADSFGDLSYLNSAFENSLSIHSPGCCIIQRSIVESLTSELALRYLEVRRVIAVSNTGAQIFLWHVARPRLLLSPLAAAPGCEYRCPLANEKSLAVSGPPFVHSASRTDSSIYFIDSL